MDCPPFPLNLYGKPWDGESPMQQLQMYAIPLAEKLVPLLIIDHILVKKVSLITFRQVLPNILLLARIFSYTIMIYSRKLNGTKSLNTKECPAGLSPRIIPQVSPFLQQKMSPPLLECVLPLVPLNLYGKRW